MSIYFKKFNQYFIMILKDYFINYLKFKLNFMFNYLIQYFNYLVY